MSEANDKFEAKALKFYQQTNMLPPGKDSALDDHTYEEREIAWEVWCKQQVHIDELQAENKALREALQEIADGKDNLGWAPCSYIAQQALQETPE